MAFGIFAVERGEASEPGTTALHLVVVTPEPEFESDQREQQPRLGVDLVAAAAAEAAAEAEAEAACCPVSFALACTKFSLLSPLSLLPTRERAPKEDEDEEKGLFVFLYVVAGFSIICVYLPPPKVPEVQVLK